MEAEPAEDRVLRFGPAIVLVGATVFVIACFLPFYDFASPPPLKRIYSLSQAHLIYTPGGPLASLGGFVSLFAGVAIIASIAIVRLRSAPPTWSLPALIAAGGVWSLWWLGTLIRQAAMLSSREVGYWLVLLGVVFVTVGTIVTKWPIASPHERRPREE